MFSVIGKHVGPTNSWGDVLESRAERDFFRGRHTLCFAKRCKHHHPVTVQMADALAIRGQMAFTAVEQQVLNSAFNRAVSNV